MARVRAPDAGGRPSKTRHALPFDSSTSAHVIAAQQSHHDHTYPKEHYLTLGDIENDCGYQELDFFRYPPLQRPANLCSTYDCSCCAQEHYVVTHTGPVQVDNSDGAADAVFLATELERLAPTIRKSTGFYLVFGGSDSGQLPMQFVDFYGRENVNVKSCITIKEDGDIQVFVHRKQLPSGHNLWDQFPTRLHHASEVHSLISIVAQMEVCVGNPDRIMTEQFNVKSEVSYIDMYDAVCGDGLVYSKTVRTRACELLTSAKRCPACVKYRGALRKRRSSGGSPITPKRKCHRYMTDMELVHKVSILSNEKKKLTRENKAFKEYIDKLLSRGHDLNKEDSKEISYLVNDCSPLLKDHFPDENSFQRLFLEQQLKQSNQSDSRGMRWHPMIIKWCLYVKSKSSQAYEAMRDAGFIQLPSSRTLFDYSNFTKGQCGLSVDVIKHLMTEAKSKGLLEEDLPWKQYVGLLQDEIKVKEDLVYDRHTGELIGYVDLDKAGNQMMDLELNVEDRPDAVARYMLVLMVRGAATNLRYPLAAYATNGITADLLHTIIWPAVRVLELTVGLKVLFITCDGASPNRRLFSIHGNEHTYYTVNPYDRTRNIYFISDVPHLLKTARNCFANSGSHQMTRQLWKDGHSISWMHIVSLFEDHVENQLFTPCPKLTRAHVDLTSFNQMRVSLAAQVFSNTVAEALELKYGDHVTETVTFVRNMDKFFDCLNTRSLTEGVQKRNPNLNAYTSPEDPRLAWLEHEFLGYLEAWKESVAARPGGYSKEERNRMTLSHQTLKGLHITVRAITACVRFLLAQGAPFVLTHKFNQDPLEQHFGHYRSKGGDNDNPTVYDVRNRINTMRVIGGQALACVRGNTGRQDERPQSTSKAETAFVGLMNIKAFLCVSQWLLK